MKEKDKISKTYFKKDNELFEQLSPNYSLIKTSYRKKIPNLLIKEVAKNIKKILYYSKYRGYYSNFLATSLHSKII